MKSAYTEVKCIIRSPIERRMLSGSFESSRSEKNSERLSKKRSNDQATDQAGTVDFYPEKSKQSHVDYLSSEGQKDWLTEGPE